ATANERRLRTKPRSDRAGGANASHWPLAASSNGILLGGLAALGSPIAATIPHFRGKVRLPNAKGCDGCAVAGGAAHRRDDPQPGGGSRSDRIFAYRAAGRGRSHSAGDP